MPQVMELSRHAFADMGEEALRSHILVQLNALIGWIPSVRCFYSSGTG
jgi:hypothetical protein